MSIGKDVTRDHKIVSPEEWLAARRTLLEEEKAFVRRQDDFRTRQRELPWVEVNKSYVFDAPEGKVSLAGLFDEKSQLFVKHFMLAPGQKTQCVGCSLEVDHVAGLIEHLENHDISYVSIARAPIEEIEAVKAAMDWRFRWVSSFHNDFNYDFHVSFRPQDIAAGTAMYNFKVGDPGMEDLSGNSIFYKDDGGRIFHTYSTSGRGGEQFLGIYSFLDLVPHGRQENGPRHSLPDWARLHNMYGKGGEVNESGAYKFPSGGHCGCHA
jgi:predicted dithiol-disulfide oxidoreductase (DUF899 family)